MKDKLLVFEIALGIGALGFSLLWVLNPESNFEPLLVLLGFVITFFEIYRRKSKPQLNEVATNIVEVTKEVETEKPNSACEKQTSEESNVVKVNEPASFGGITLEQLSEGLNKDNFTSMQISQFVKRTTGTEITCEVLVQNIQEGFSLDEENSFIMVFSPIAQLNEFMPNFITASFHKTNKSDLASISSGDSAVICAEVGFIELAGNYSISLKKAKVLSIRKMPNK